MSWRTGTGTSRPDVGKITEEVYPGYQFSFQPGNVLFARKRSTIGHS